MAPESSPALKEAHGLMRELSQPAGRFVPNMHGTF